MVSSPTYKSAQTVFICLTVHVVLIASAVLLSVNNVYGYDQGPMFNAGVGYMFKSLAVTIVDELQGKNVSVHGELLTKISFLNGGMRQLMAIAENRSPQVFDTIKPIVKDVMEKGRPQYEKIKFTDEDLINRFAWNSTQIAQFRSLHTDIGKMLYRLGQICKKHNYNYDKS